MLKIRSGIIYIVIFAVVSGSIGPERLALAENLVVDPPALEHAVEKLSTSNETFFVTEETKAEVEKALAPKKTPAEEEKAEKEQAGSGWATAQSMVTSFVILAVGALHQKAHEENLKLTPENQKALTDKLGGLWPAFKSVLLETPGWFFTYKLNGVLSDAVFKSETGKKLAQYVPFFRSAASEKLFKYLVSSGLLSIGADYVKGFVIFAAQEVLDHPSRFGGLDNAEQAALKVLQTPVGFEFFLKGLLYNGESLLGKPNTQYAGFSKINVKILKAMALVLYHSDLRVAMWDHLTREALLQGGNGFVIFSSIVSDIVTQLAAEEGVTIKGFNKKAVLISIGVGLAASLIPNVTKDWGTAQANSRQADLQHKYESEKIKWEISHFNTNQRPDKLQSQLNSIFKDEALSRESRFVKYAYLMKLAADRIDTIRADKDQVLYYQTAKGKSEIKKPVGFGQWSVYYFNQFWGGDLFFSDKNAVNWDDWSVEVYENLFKKATSKMMSIYADSSVSFRQFDTINLPAAARQQVALEQLHFQQMVVFINYLSQTLSQQWTLSTPETNYFPARSLLEQIAFWGIHETDILDVVASGSIVKH